MKKVYDSMEYREFRNEINDDIGDIIASQSVDEEVGDGDRDEYREYFERFHYIYDTVYPR
jgi:hypothetical protein